MSLSKWLIATAGLALVVGAMAWLTKIGVIIATDGRVTHTGAAGSSFAIGLGLLSVGAAGLGLRLSMSVDLLVLRVILTVGFTFVFVLSFFVFSAIGYVIVAGARVIVGDALPRYMLGEAGILISAVVWMVIGAVLLFGSVRKPRNAASSRVG
jgi:hypothetical protein